MEETARKFKWSKFIGVLLLFLVLEGIAIILATFLIPSLTTFQPDGLSIHRVDVRPAVDLALDTPTSPNGRYLVEASAYSASVIDASNGAILAQLHVDPSSEHLINAVGWQDDETIVLQSGMSNQIYLIWSWRRARVITPLRLILVALLLLPFVGLYLGYRIARRG